MKKSKIFIGAATLVLGITAYMASNANSKKFVAFSTAVTSGGAVKVIGTNLFTTVANASQAYLLTAGGTQKALFTKVSRIKVAYMK
jgi:uncharacterized membrane-anchored protein